ncbi:beta-1,3-galactosyltransferase 5 [Huso huso]|uniref:Hexosyltransferase n=1 Tax=Huso huso TaxID=61971 RepID=A0ABR0YBU4_HUSHU
MRLRRWVWIVLLLTAVLSCLLSVDHIEGWWMSWGVWGGALSAEARTRALAALRREQEALSTRLEDFYLLPNERSCAPTAPFLLSLVTSAPPNAEARHAIRQTWGSLTSVGGRAVRTLFLLGIPDTPAQRQALASEAERHGDIVQGNFRDSYANLTLKTLSLLRWTARYCPRASFITKVDDDVMLNYEVLLPYLERLRSNEEKGEGEWGETVGNGSREEKKGGKSEGNVKGEERWEWERNRGWSGHWADWRGSWFSGPDLYLGRVHRGVVPIRDPRSKSFVSHRVYPQDRFPQYCSGTAYVLSSSAARKLYLTSYLTPPCPLEDVFVGLSARGAGLRPSHCGLFSGGPRIPFGRCCYGSLIAAHHVTAAQQHQYWGELRGGPPCSWITGKAALGFCKLHALLRDTET